MRGEKRREREREGDEWGKREEGNGREREERASIHISGYATAASTCCSGATSRTTPERPSVVNTSDYDRNFTRPIPYRRAEINEREW